MRHLLRHGRRSGPGPASLWLQCLSAPAPPQAICFSFVTQATLVFGDIVPRHEHAQGIVVARGIGGQMYRVVLVAQRVSHYSAQEKQ